MICSANLQNVLRAGCFLCSYLHVSMAGGELRILLLHSLTPLSLSQGNFLFLFEFLFDPLVVQDCVV